MVSRTRREILWQLRVDFCTWKQSSCLSTPPSHSPFISFCVCVEKKKEKTFHEQPTNIFKMSTRKVELKLLLHSLQARNELSLWFSLRPRQSRRSWHTFLQPRMSKGGSKGMRRSTHELKYVYIVCTLGEIHSQLAQVCLSQSNRFSCENSQLSLRFKGEASNEPK